MNLVDYLAKNEINMPVFWDIAEQTHLSEDWEILVGLLEKYAPGNEHLDVAYALMEEFENLPTILSQDTSALMRVKGINHEIANGLLMIRRAAILIAEKRIRLKPALNNWQAIENYCRTAFGYSGRQNVMAIYLDAEFRPIRSEQISKGTVNQVAVYPREIIGRILQLDAYSIIIAKSIPTGRLQAKPCEVQAAKKLKAVCESIDVHFTDAVLVGKSGVRSMLRD